MHRQKVWFAWKISSTLVGDQADMVAPLDQFGSKSIGGNQVTPCAPCRQHVLAARAFTSFVHVAALPMPVFPSTPSASIRPGVSL